MPKPIPVPVQKPKEEPITIINDDAPKPKPRPKPKNTVFTHQNQRNLYAHDSSTIAYRLIPRPDFSKK